MCIFEKKNLKFVKFGSFFSMSFWKEKSNKKHVLLVELMKAVGLIKVHCVSLFVSQRLKNQTNLDAWTNFQC